MTGARDTMELREDTIRAQYDAALGLLTGFDHAPRLAKAVDAPAPERSAGIGTRPRFRSTVPGMAARSTARPGGVRLVERVEGLGDGLISPAQASALHALRRGLAISLAMGETFAAQSGLAELKKANLEGRVPDLRRAEFTELLAAEALMTRVALRAETAPRLGAFTASSWRVEADKLAISGFKPARAAKGGALTMQFKKPTDVVGNQKIGRAA